jgi:flagellar protein FliL
MSKPAAKAKTATAESPAAPHKSGKMKKILMMGGAALVLVGAGVAGGIYASGMTGAKNSDATEVADVPQKVKRDEKHGGSGYETTYFPVPDSFTANLRGSSHYVQVSLSVATHYDDRIIKNLEKHNFALRSQILSILAEQEEAFLATPDGKQALRKQLLTAINAELLRQEKFGGIHDVYFTSFIIQ